MSPRPRPLDRLDQRPVGDPLPPRELREQPGLINPQRLTPNALNYSSRSYSFKRDVDPRSARRAPVAGPARNGYEAADLPLPHPPAMPASPEDLLAYLENLGIATATVEHPPLFTVEESQALRGDIPGGHTKNLFVKDKKGRLFLLVLGEETEVDLKRVHERIGGQGRVSFGSAELLEEVWGVRPGAVTPFGAINDRGRPRQRRAGRGDDGARAPQFPSAGQHPHDGARERRPRQVPARDRARAARHAARPGRGNSCIRRRRASI